MDEILRRAGALSLAIVSICACQESAQVEYSPLPIEEVIPDDVIPQAGRTLPNQVDRQKKLGFSAMSDKRLC